MLESVVFLLLVCFLADIVIGDPPGWPHPVRLQGRFLNWLEPKARSSGRSLQVCGVLIMTAGVLLTYSAAALLISIPYFGLIFAIYLGYSALALGCLVHETRKAQKFIAAKKMDKARKAVAGLVSRDTRDMDEQELYQSLAESAAENYTDAFCAPFFYLSLLGVPWVWAYKFVSTMDSMWGYRINKWKDLGSAGARADDVLAWLPARLAALSMICAGCILFPGRRISVRAIIRDARRTDSPNAGWTMSAAAHLLGVRMGGACSYFGIVRDKPVLGPGTHNYSSETIDLLVRVILVSSCIYAALFIALAAFMS